MKTNTGKTLHSFVLRYLGKDITDEQLRYLRGLMLIEIKEWFKDSDDTAIREELISLLYSPHEESIDTYPREILMDVIAKILTGSDSWPIWMDPDEVKVEFYHKLEAKMNELGWK